MSLHKIIVAAPTKEAVFFTLFKNPIIVIHFNSRINHDNCFHPYIRQISNHFLRVRKVLFIPGKAAIAIHIIDI
ncbi:hypothetical protein D9M68_598260 [compost metagenome]